MPPGQIGRFPTIERIEQQLVVGERIAADGRATRQLSEPRDQSLAKPGAIREFGLFQERQDRCPDKAIAEAVVKVRTLAVENVLSVLTDHTDADQVNLQRVGVLSIKENKHTL